MTARYNNAQSGRSEPSIWPPSPPAPIIGRQRELSLVMNRYEAAKSGHAHVLLLAGEPGIGKTCLLDDIALRTARDGAVVLRGGASEAEGMPPYLPFLEALGRYVQDASLDQLHEQVAAASPVLASILPELVVRLGDLAVPRPLPPEQARFRLYEAVGTFLQSIGLPHVLVLLFDDLHWADTASLDLLCHLARRQSHAHVLLVGAYRDSELDRNPAFTRTVAELSRQRMLTTVVLKPLSCQEIEALALHLLGSPLSSGVVSLLYAHSEGNPFFAEELLRGWIETGALIQEQNQWVAVGSIEQTLPPSIATALRQRFARLSLESIDDLRVAAIIGRTFDPSLLAAVQQEEIEVLEERLLEAARARLVQADRERGFTFSHDKIRECLSAEVSSSRRRRLHGIIGHVLEEHIEQEEEAEHVYHLAELAFHFAHSDDRERGIAYSLRAASQALRTFAVEEVLSHYRTALELLRLDDRRRGDLLLNLGEAALMAGQEAEAEDAYGAAQCWFAQGENREALARAAHGLGMALWRQEKRAEAYTAIKHALEVLGEHRCAEAVKVLADLSVLLTSSMGKQEEGIAYAQQALVIAHELGNTEVEALAHRKVAGNLASLRGDDLSSAMQLLEQVLTRTAASGDLAEAAECCLHLTVASYWMAEITRSHEASAHRIALAEQCRQPHHLRTAYSWQVLLFASQGLWTEAERVIALAHSMVSALTNPLPAALLHQFCGFLAYQQENYDVAERELQEAQVDEGLQSGLGDLMFYQGLLGLVQAMMGKEGEARTYMAQVEAHLATLPVGMLPTAPLMICLALTAMALGDNERAKRLYSHLLAFHGQHYWFLVDRVLGMLALHAGQWDAARVHLAAAETIARREGLQPELARTLFEQANLEIARGDQGSTTRVGLLLKRALALFEALGMSDSIRRVRRQLRTLTHQSRGPLSPPFPAHLTRRELAVLRLVVEGRSNGQIAQVLGLSEKTVTNHLTHIFNKTTCDNRTAATAFAIRHGLA